MTPNEPASKLPYEVTMFNRAAPRPASDPVRRLTPAQMVEETYRRMIRLESKLHAFALAQGVDLNKQLDEEFLREK